MAKRFVDTELDDKPWFNQLSCRLKCAVQYVFRKCDNAGIWEPNYVIAAAYVGEGGFREDELLAIDNGQQFERLANGKIFVVGFCDFQYGTLSEDCKPHRAVIQKLKKYGLYERVLKGYGKGLETLQEKDKEKDKDNKGGMGGEIYDVQQFVSSRQKDFEKICMTCRKTPQEADAALTKYHLWMEREGRYPVSKRQALAGFELWLLNEKKPPGPEVENKYEDALTKARKNYKPLEP